GRFSDLGVVVTRARVSNELVETRWDVATGQRLADRTLTKIPDPSLSDPNVVRADDLESLRNDYRIAFLDTARRDGNAIPDADAFLEMLASGSLASHRREGISGDSVILSRYLHNDKAFYRALGGHLLRIIAVAHFNTLDLGALRRLSDQVMWFIYDFWFLRGYFDDANQGPQFLSLSAVDLSKGGTRWTRNWIAPRNADPTIIVRDRVVVVVTEGRCEVLDPKDGRSLWVIPMDGSVRSSRDVSISPGGRYLVIKSPKIGRTRAFDLATGAPRVEILGHNLMFAPDDRHVATWYDGGVDPPFHAGVPGPNPARIRLLPVPEGLKIWRMPEEDPKSLTAQP
ncbi:MAG: PQQ-binding-like beta-propeller repeat protein, partial [Isosphaeraceae bacterium]